MIEILFLLLPVAAASGWLLARRDLKLRLDGASARHPEFLRGLNYLLEEQPDKAIDTFLKLAEVDGETVETHLALGSLFRRRGEVDRAIRIHQNLVARNNLGAEARAFALFELGQDYMRAGLLDRAEELFQELVGMGLHAKRALQALRDIYQQERDWAKCLGVAARLQAMSGVAMAVEIAQYHCELAEEARRHGDTQTASRELALAQQADPNCVRAAMLEGFAALERDDPGAAMALFQRVAERNAAYVPEILPAFIEATQRLPGGDTLALLEDLARRRASPPLMLSLSEAVAERRGPAAALELLTQYLRRFADLAVLERLLALQAQLSVADPQPCARAQIAHQVVRQLLERQPVYQCEHCGFQGRSLHWQCPSCKRWGTVTPVQPEPILGETPPSGPRDA